MNIEKIKSIVDDKAATGCSITCIDMDEKTYTFGTYSQQDTRKITQETVFDLASISKLYTTALALRLHERGILDIYAYCSSYLDIFIDSELKVIDLLTQRASFNVRLSTYREPPNLFKDNVFKIKPPLTASDNVVYENITFLYIGKLIEKVTNMSLRENLQTMIKELNLKNTFLGGDSRLDAPATKYENGKDFANETHDESAHLVGGVAGNAGVFASSSDLAKFGKLWLENKIISPSLLRHVFKNYAKTQEQAQGIGWWNRIPGFPYHRDLYSHTGFTGGILAVNIQTKKVYSLTTNRTYYGRDNQSHRALWKELLASEFSLLS